jgi:lysine 2,3-aminomutase
MRAFVENRAKPYYLHHGDLAPGTSHFRTTIANGQSLVRHLRGRFSGLCQPTYVLDIPGGHGKSPIGPSYLEQGEADRAVGAYRIEDYRGERHRYPPPLDGTNGGRADALRRSGSSASPRRDRAGRGSPAEDQ